MTVVGWLLVALFVANTAIIVNQVEKPRAVITGPVAAGVAVVNSLLILAICTWGTGTL